MQATNPSTAIILYTPAETVILNSMRKNSSTPTINPLWEYAGTHFKELYVANWNSTSFLPARSWSRIDDDSLSKFTRSCLPWCTLDHDHASKIDIPVWGQFSNLRMPTQTAHTSNAKSPPPDDSEEWPIKESSKETWIVSPINFSDF